MRRFEYVNRILSNGVENLTPKFELPKRNTEKSAGYDFICPEDVILKPKEICYIKTGVKAYFQDDEMLVLANRSSNPKKKGLILINGIGIIDTDYVDNPDNEGEIAFAFMNMRDEEIEIKAGEKLGQGIFMKYGIIDNDNAQGNRNGGFGSTGK